MSNNDDGIINDELDNNGSSSLNGNKYLNGFSGGLKNGFKPENEDVKKFSNLGNNLDDNNKKKKEKDEDEKSDKKDSLGGKDELSKDGLDKDKLDKNGLDSKKDNKKDSKSKSKDDKSSLKDKIDVAGALKAKIKKYIIIGILAVFGFFIALVSLLMIFDSFTSAIATFFGINEYKEREDDDERFESLYGDAELAELTEDELLEKLNGDDPLGSCVNSGGSFYDKLYFFFDPNRNFKDVCQLLRIVNETIDEYEKKYSIKLDYGLIVATIFYGYDEQAIGDYYKDPSNETMVFADEHYSVLENIIDNRDSSGKYTFTRYTLLRIIQSQIFEEVYPFFNYSVETETKEVPKKDANGKVMKDENGNVIKETKIAKVIAKCEQTNVEKYWLSLEKYKMFMRFNDDGENNEQNATDKFSIPGYMATTKTDNGFLNLFATNSSKVLNREKLNDNDDTFLDLVGSGYVYDTNMNSAFETTDEECNGSISLEELTEQLKQMCTDPDDCEVDLSQAEDGINFFKDRNITDIVDTTIYFQKVEDTKSTEEDVFESRSIPYSYLISSGNVGMKSSIAEEGNENSDSLFDYTQGFAYKNFPGFKKADEDENLPYYNYDSIFTAKKIENVIEEIDYKKDDYNEILKCDPTYGVDSPQNGIISEALYEAISEYCEEYGDAGSYDFDNMTVTLVDCASNPITTVSFKDYIIGVAYAEIGGSTNKDYALTQMVASISYALNRHGNYLKGSNITMKSGSCDQNWCSTSEGCSRKTPPGTQYASSYPGLVEGSTTNKVCNGQSGYWYCPNSSVQSLYSGYYDIAKKYLLVSGNSGKIYSSGYSSGVQNKWRTLAESGMSFTDILSDHYPNATLVNCLDIPGSIPGYAGGGTPGTGPGSGNKPGAAKLSCTGYINNSIPSPKGSAAAQKAISNVGNSIGDCSGFVTKMYSEVGLTLKRIGTGSGRRSAAIANAYRNTCVTAANLAPGDLIFMGKKGTNAVTHVAIYVGGPYNGYYIVHSTTSNHTARYVDFNTGWGNYEILQYSRIMN